MKNKMKSQGQKTGFGAGRNGLEAFFSSVFKWLLMLAMWSTETCS